MNALNPNIFPKDGYWYQESDGTKIVAQSWAGVAARVRNYRRRAGIPPGDAEQDVIDQACARNPVLCRNDDGTRQKETDKATLKTRSLKWLALIREKLLEVQFSPEEDTPRARANVCARCPKNIEIGGGCSSCRNTLAEHRKEILGRRTRDSRLNSCLVLGEDNQISIWLEQPSVENNELPDYCWRKRTL